MSHAIMKKLQTYAIDLIFYFFNGGKKLFYTLLYGLKTVSYFKERMMQAMTKSAIDSACGRDVEDKDTTPWWKTCWKTFTYRPRSRRKDDIKMDLEDTLSQVDRTVITWGR
jgi:hypothetical protein